MPKHATKSKEPRHVRIYHSFMATEAWSNLDPLARCVYIEVLKRYWGGNNGLIGLSVRQVALELRCGKATALRALGRLQDLGFLVAMKKGAFNVKVRHATEWRLTEFSCDVTGTLPTRDFARWKKSSVPSQNPDGFQNGTERVPKRNGRVRDNGPTVPPGNLMIPVTVPPEGHI